MLIKRVFVSITALENYMQWKHLVQKRDPLLCTFEMCRPIHILAAKFTETQRLLLSTESSFSRTTHLGCVLSRQNFPRLLPLNQHRDRGESVGVEPFSVQTAFYFSWTSFRRIIWENLGLISEQPPAADSVISRIATMLHQANDRLDQQRNFAFCYLSEHFPRNYSLIQLFIVPFDC